jgi:hypothetical protein
LVQVAGAQCAVRERPYNVAASAIRFIGVQTLTHFGRIAVNRADRRRESRRPAVGSVQLKFENESPCEVDVDLLEVGESSFRAHHRHGLLPLGANASFQHSEAAGMARVVWNWRHPDYVETGFVVVR